MFAPLHDLTTEHVWNWQDKHEIAFKQVKEALSKHAVLGHPDFGRPFILDTDASNIGMAAIVSQPDAQGLERIIAMDSRKFTVAELKWHIREKEALAIVWGLERFKAFLLGSPFIVRTDHSSLKWLLEAKSGRLQRWAIRLSPFTPFRIVHRSGRLHSNVDAFTRTFAIEDTLPDEAYTFGIISQTLDIFPSDEVLRNAQTQCKSCQALRSSKKAVVRDEIVGLGRRHKWRPVLPISLAKPTAQKWHASLLGGHASARKLLSFMSRKFVIPRGISIVNEVIRNCRACLERKPSLRKHGLMKSAPPTTPWNTVAMDFCGPYSVSKSGNRYILIFVDQFTKWVELIVTSNQLATTVIEAFYSNVICRHGCPLRLLSDNGPQFKSAIIETLCAYFGIQKIFSSAYYPQGDGYAERFMRTLNNSLSVLSREDPDNWDKYVPGLSFAYNNVAHGATGISPFELKTGRVSRMPGERSIGDSGTQNQPIDYLKRLRNIITNQHQRARQCVESYWNTMKRNYDKNRKDITLDIGTTVLVRLTEQERASFASRKLAPRWSSPATIAAKLTNDVTYRVTWADGRERTVHISLLLPLQNEPWGSGFHADQLSEPSNSIDWCLNEPSTQSNMEDDDDDAREIVIQPLAKVDQSSATQVSPARTSLQQTTPANTGGTKTHSADHAMHRPRADANATAEAELQNSSTKPALHKTSSSLNANDLIDNDKDASRTRYHPSDFSSPQVYIDSSADSSDTASEIQLFTVDHLGQAEARNGEIWYEVHWEGYNSPTWQRRAILLQDVPSIVQEHESPSHRYHFRSGRSFH